MYKEFNQVFFHEQVATITRVSGEIADLFVISGDSIQCHYGINISSDLMPIPVSEKILDQCKPSEKEVAWYFDFEHSKYQIQVCANGYYTVKKDSEKIKEGHIEYLHELQNVIREYTEGHILIMS